MSHGEKELKISPEKVRFHLQKSPQYRVLHIDGVFGGPTTHGFIHMALFSEHFPLPKVVVHPLDSEAGKLGDELREEREGLDGVVRELEVSAILKPEVAVSLAQWLLEKAVDAGVVLQTAEGESGVADVADGNDRVEDQP